MELWFLIEDPLESLTPLFDVPAKPNFKGLPLALGEDGLVWPLRLLANHVLVIGATGAGKGSVLWSLVRALGHGIRTKLVELWVVDPKGGMEFAAGQPLFARYCYGDDEATDVDRKRAYELTYAEFLEQAVATLRERQRRLRGIFRMHRPAPGDPLIVIVIDEIASLTSYVVDREAKKRIEAALNLLLSQGRAVGVVVVGAGQDARKEVVAMRGLFPTRIALRLNEADEADMVLGTGARDRGARCEEIPTDLPGVGYVRIETNPEPVRVRFGYVDDDEIQTMCSLFQPGAKVPELRLVSNEHDGDRPGRGGGVGLMSSTNGTGTDLGTVDVATAVQDEARQAYRHSVTAGTALTGRELGEMFGRGERWGRARINEVRTADAARHNGNGHVTEVAPAEPRRPTQTAVRRQPHRHQRQSRHAGGTVAAAGRCSAGRLVRVPARHRRLGRGERRPRTTTGRGADRWRVRAVGAAAGGGVHDPTPLAPQARRLVRLLVGNGPLRRHRPGRPRRRRPVLPTHVRPAPRLRRGRAERRHRTPGRGRADGRRRVRPARHEQPPTPPTATDTGTETDR